MANIDSLSVRDIASSVADGTLSAVEVTRAALDAVQAREAEVQAFIDRFLLGRDVKTDDINRVEDLNEKLK